jgi:replication factor C small subunit
MSNSLNNLWIEKYRPKELSDVVLPDNFRSFFQQCIDDRSIPNLMFVGSAGTGKTTLARILIDKIIGDDPEAREYDLLQLNGSSSTSVDVARGLITDFIKMPVIGDQKIKIIHIDEFDYSSQAQQAALRSIMEEYSGTCRFIFTLNLKHKIMDAIFSRCQLFEFKSTVSKDYIVQFISNIIEKELNETNKDEIIRQYVNKYYPDIRKTLNAIQSKVVNGQLIDDIIKVTKSESDVKNVVKEIFINIKNNNLNSIQGSIKNIETLLNENEIDYVSLYTSLFDDDGISFSSKVIVNKYSNKHMEALIPQMNFLSMIFEMIEFGIKKSKS